MKQFLISILLIFSQDAPKIITIANCYSGKGVIFNKNHDYPFKNNEYNKGVDLTIQQVKNAEYVLFNEYYNYHRDLAIKFNSILLIKKKFKDPIQVKNKFKKYYRQYYGYINNNNDTIIYVGLFNFSNKKKAEKYFIDWDKLIFLGNDGFYDSNQESFLVDLNKKRLIN